MREGSFEHDRHDLHLLVMVEGKSALGRNCVVIHHSEYAKPHPLGIHVVGKTVGEAAREPPKVAFATFICPLNMSHGPLGRNRTYIASFGGRHPIHLTTRSLPCSEPAQPIRDPQELITPVDHFSKAPFIVFYCRVMHSIAIASVCAKMRYCPTARWKKSKEIPSRQAVRDEPSEKYPKTPVRRRVSEELSSRRVPEAPKRTARPGTSVFPPKIRRMGRGRGQHPRLNHLALISRSSDPASFSFGTMLFSPYAVNQRKGVASPREISR